MSTNTDLTNAGPVHDEGRAWTGRVAVAAAVVALAAGGAACGSAAGATTAQSGCGSGAPRITVVANGQASATPDTLTITIGVSVSDPTASAALSDANQQAATLTNSLKSSGVTPADIQSTNFSINPMVNVSGTITGYQVENTLLVTLHNLAGAGQAIDAAAASVGNAVRINGLSFSVSDSGNVDGRARADAVETAAAHARAMTAASGESLGGICSISDSTTSPVPYYAAGTPNAASSALATVPLEPGSQQADAQVTVVYAIGPK
jgi:uncharacterized protein YggE